MPRKCFHLELNSIDEFVLFCALIRGEDPDDAKFATLTERLRVAAQGLQAAITADHPRVPSSQQK